MTGPAVPDQPTSTDSGEKQAKPRPATQRRVECTWCWAQAVQNLYVNARMVAKGCDEHAAQWLREDI